MTEMNQHEDEALEQRLLDQRALPSAGFRARLRTQLVSSANRRGVAPKRLRVLIVAYGGSGFALFLVAALGVAGAGPLAS